MLLARTTQRGAIRFAATGIALAALLAVPVQAIAAAPAQPSIPMGQADLGGAGKVRVTPNALRVVAGPGQHSQSVLTLTNTRAGDVAWQIADGGGLRHTSESIRPPATGGVLKSWPATGLSVGWGIGIESGNVWISDTDILRNDSFTVDGVRRDEGWPTPWTSPGPGPADMAYLPDRALMCQVKVIEDNGIYCWDPRTGDVVTSISGQFPWSTTSQRGLAYRPDDDSFYIGGEKQGLIYHISGLSSPNPGSVISQCAPADPAISGLGWSPGFDRLWVTTHSADDLIYAIDPDTCETLSTLSPPDQDQFTGAGLDVDAKGNLWTMSTGSPGTAYLINSGQPSFTDTSWLSTTPETGALAGGAKQRLTVRVDTTGLAPGRYSSTLYLLTDNGHQPLTTVPVRLLVR